MIRIGLIGFGRWGYNLANAFYHTPYCALVSICDASEKRLKIASETFKVKTYDEIEDFLNSKIDAVAIATPAPTHAKIIERCLMAGKHVFTEKPFTTILKDAKHLASLSPKLVKMVDFTYVYHPGIQRLKEIILEKRETPSFIDIWFSGYEPERVDVSAYMDWMPHPISILAYLFPKIKPISTLEISPRTSYSTFKSGNTYIRILVSYEMSRQRKIEIVFEDETVVFDEVNYNPEDCVKRIGSLKHTKVDTMKPLDIACSEFVNAILWESKPLTDFDFGCKVVELICEMRS